LRDLLHAADTGTHVEPAKITVAQWADQWLAMGAPGRKANKAGRRSVERYRQLLHGHIVPMLGARRLQQLQAVEIEQVYAGLADKLEPKTQHMVHVVFGALLGAARRRGLLMANPMERVGQVPAAGESNHGVALDADQLGALVDGFRGSAALFPIVATLALTGARRNEVLALRWSDFDPVNKTLRIERALEADTGIVKSPKTKRGERVITIDDNLVALLVTEREKYLRLVAGVPDGPKVDLSLVKLPERALIFPTLFGGKIDLSRPRCPRAVTKAFVRYARKLGFKLRLHDLRGAHETALLDAGVPAHVVAERCGHDAAVLLRNYAKRTRKHPRLIGSNLLGPSWVHAPGLFRRPVKEISHLRTAGRRVGKSVVLSVLHLSACFPRRE
jgi:integrase